MAGKRETFSKMFSKAGKMEINDKMTFFEKTSCRWADPRQSGGERGDRCVFLATSRASGGARGTSSWHRIVRPAR